MKNLQWLVTEIMKEIFIFQEKAAYILLVIFDFSHGFASFAVVFWLEI